jgi:phosphoadenosine phosphosulfate reductase
MMLLSSQPELPIGKPKRNYPLSHLVYWCDACQHPVWSSEVGRCPQCEAPLRYLTTDARPVFARERRILQFYGHGPLTTEAVWRSSKNRFYYVNGKPVALPNAATLKEDLPAIADYIRDSNHYDTLDRQLIEAYRRQLEVNRPHLAAIEDEAFQFVQHAILSSA